MNIKKKKNNVMNRILEPISILDIINMVITCMGSNEIQKGYF